MWRYIAFVGILAGVLLIPCRSAAQKKDKEPPTATAAELKAMLKVLVPADVFTGDGVTLEKALDFLSEMLTATQRKKVVFKVNRDSFTNTDPDAPDILKQQVRLKMGPQKLPLGTVLDGLLKSIVVPPGAYTVREGYIEIHRAKGKL